MAADEKWYFTKEQLANTPSRRCGFDADKELSYRQQAANFIQDMGQRLAVSQLCINTAIVYMHRFYVFHSLTQFHRNAIASAALFLAAKVEEQPRKLEHVIKVAHMCLHREQPAPDTKSEQYLEQAQDLVFNENVLLQTLGFDVAIDHPHTHVVRCCHLVKASKDLAQTSYFMASNSLHLTTMCLQYKPTVVACFCIHLACKWSNWEIPQSNEGKHWFWYVDTSVTSELLQQLTAEFLHIFDRCPSRLKRKIMSISANQSPSMSHPSLPSSPFDVEPRKIQSPATSDGPTFQSNRPYLMDKEDKKPLGSVPGKPSVSYRDYQKERERLEREKAGAAAAAATAAAGHPVDPNKHSHNHKPIPGLGMLGKHPAVPGQKAPLHHNHHHRPEMKPGQPMPQRHSSSGQPKDPNRDPNRQRGPREYNSSSGASGGTMYSHGHPVHPPKDSNVDTSANDPAVNRPDTNLSQEQMSHNPQDKLSNNNHSIHRLSGVDTKHQPHDRRPYDPMRHKPPEHRNKDEQKLYSKYTDPSRMERQRKPDVLEQRSEEVRKLIEKPLPPLKPRIENSKEDFIANTMKQPHHPKYNQEKLQGNPVVVLNQMKMPLASQSMFVKEKSPVVPVSATSQMSAKSIGSKAVPAGHTGHGVPQIIKETIKNGNSQFQLNNLEEPKMEKRQTRHDEVDRISSGSQQQALLQTPPNKHRSLFSPEKTPALRESSHSQRTKSKQKTPPSAAKVPKQERQLESLMNLSLVSPFASPPAVQQDPSPSKRMPTETLTLSSHKRHRTSSETEQSGKIKTEDPTGFDPMKMMGRIPELIQPIRDQPTPANGRNTSVANDLKPPELIKPFEPESLLTRTNTMSQQPLVNGFDPSLVKPEPHETLLIKQEKAEAPVLIKQEYLSPMKSAQSISALLQEPLAPMPSLLQQSQQFAQSVQQQQQQQVHIQTQSLPPPVATETCNISTTDTCSAANVVSTQVAAVETLAVPGTLERRSEHHKSEKKKKKEKHKHKDKDKSKEERKHKHKHKDKDKEKHKDKDKDKERKEEIVSTVPIKITIPKDKLNLGNEPSVAIAAHPDKTKSPQGPGLKIKIPKERLKGTDSVASSPAQPVQPVQGPLKIKIRTDAITRSGGNGDSFSCEGRKRDRDVSNTSPTTSGGPPSKKHSQSSYVQGTRERLNGRHYTASSNNKEKHSSHHKSSSKNAQQQQQSHAT